MPFGEMAGVQPASHALWNPGTNLFEVTVVRRNGPDLVIKDLPPQTASRLREGPMDAMGERHA